LSRNLNLDIQICVQIGNIKRGWVVQENLFARALVALVVIVKSENNFVRSSVFWYFYLVLIYFSWFSVFLHPYGVLAIFFKLF
jgi:hypothetical protein